MTLKQYQVCYSINEIIKDDIERMAMIICELWDKSPDEVDNLTRKQFAKYCNKVEKLFKKGFKKPFYSFRKFETDATKFTFGQFIEMQYWLKKSPIDNLHLVAATISKSKKDHSIKANYYLTHNASYCVNDCLKAIDSLNELVSKFKGLFELPENDAEDLQEFDKKEKLNKHPFIEIDGWTYAAREVGQWLGLNVHQAYELGIMEALNTLSTLKRKQDYDKQMNK